MLISVIVPVYNVERYLRRCVFSFMEQTYGKIEIILVDDGSSDWRGAICDELTEEDGRIRVVHKANGGVGSARNVGIDMANGEYLCFVDSDDWLNVDYFQKAVPVLKKIQPKLLMNNEEPITNPFENWNILDTDLVICKRRSEGNVKFYAAFSEIVNDTTFKETLKAGALSGDKREHFNRFLLIRGGCSIIYCYDLSMDCRRMCDK